MQGVRGHDLCLVFRVSERTNLFLVSESEESWRRLDKKWVMRPWGGPVCDVNASLSVGSVADCSFVVISVPPDPPSE